MIQTMRSGAMRVMSASFGRWSEWGRVQTALIVVSTVVTTSIGMAIILDADNITNNIKAFSVAMSWAPAQVWGAAFIIAGLALFITRRNHRRAEISALGGSAIFGLWGVLTVFSVPLGGVGTAPIAYLGISAFCAITALACSTEERG